MNKKLMISADEVAETLGVSMSHAYKIVRLLNKDLEAYKNVIHNAMESLKTGQEKFNEGANALKDTVDNINTILLILAILLFCFITDKTT